jgi:hypothetical protein
LLLLSSSLTDFRPTDASLSAPILLDLEEEKDRVLVVPRTWTEN